jgi:hypothetical protein
MPRGDLTLAGFLALCRDIALIVFVVVYVIHTV